MLEELNVQGIGGIETASLRFSGNFIVITGESGSGKSSLVRAVEFISGKRAQVSSIHAIKESALVAAKFKKRLSTHDGTERDLLAVERTLNKFGKGRCKVDGVSVTVAELARNLQPHLGIQSQFAQLSLLDPQKQLDLVDSCGGIELQNEKIELSRVFLKVLDLEKEFIALKAKRKKMEMEYEGAESVISTVKKLSLNNGSEEQLKEDLLDLESEILKQEKILRFITLFSGEDNHAGLLDQLESLCREAKSVAPDGDGEKWEHFSNESLNALQRLYEMAIAQKNNICGRNFDSEIELIEEKLGVIRKIKRATGSTTVAQLLSYAKDAESAVNWLQGSYEELERKNELIERARDALRRLLLSVREKRRIAAKKLETRVQNHLRTLGMEDIIFSISLLEQARIRISGAETVQFMISRKDQPLGAVSKNASGGELSRILVALQASIEPENLPQTLVFDEVEAGLGGKAALLTANKLKEISRGCQIILITHEATIAAIAEQHFIVKRDGDKTIIEQLDGENRAKEIARMLAGSETQEALEHARSLLSSGN